MILISISRNGNWKLFKKAKNILDFESEDWSNVSLFTIQISGFNVPQASIYENILNLIII